MTTRGSMTTLGSGGIAPFLNDPAIVRLHMHCIPVTRAQRALMPIKQREDGHGQAECEQRKTEGGVTRFRPGRRVLPVLQMVLV